MTCASMPNSHQVTLTYQGLVSQSTGEDWQQVGLTLSTARPSQVTRVPELDPWYLQASLSKPSQPPANREGLALGAMAQEQPIPAPQAATGYAASHGLRRLVAQRVDEAEARQKHSRRGGLATTSVEQTGGALLFHTSHRADVPSDGAPHTIAIARDDLPCAFDYVTAPVIDPVAHLRATITNRTERVGHERDPPTQAVSRCSVRFARALR